LLKKLHYSLKCTKFIPERRNDILTIDVRYHYAVRFCEIEDSFGIDEIFFLDELGFNVSMRTRFGRSLIGTTPIETVPAIRTRNLSVCSAIRRNGVFFIKLFIIHILV
jgi:hypothetical protein